MRFPVVFFRNTEKSVTEADHLIFLFRQDASHRMKKIGSVFTDKAFLHNINRLAFDHVQKIDLISFPVGSDWFIKRDFSGALFLERSIIKSSLSIQRAAYVERRADFFMSKVEIALISPIVPMEIRSSMSSSVFWYF